MWNALKIKAILTLAGIPDFFFLFYFYFFPIAAALGPFALERLGIPRKHKFPEEYLCTFSFQLNELIHSFSRFN